MLLISALLLLTSGASLSSAFVVPARRLAPVSGHKG
eukprot:gene22228-16662_t